MQRRDRVKGALLALVAAAAYTNPACFALPVTLS